ncbi:MULTISPECIES: hypothetical protein [unclassified Amycolatopsis]|uniref:hypothetical protein n=1 Tax=unclassified Amycolatopsis TaxID=2618356 RepID=UPI002874E8EB|nr:MULTISPECIES: hypothetical protein [unclassified Amycolatopsis]MDS0134203.1 hypothetical protein [Amycolatopsis sp. 505]MDS0146856.1 hypothetical protein [Amycolatopsis sp. CM201R]
MRRITAALGALALTTGVLIGASAAASVSASATTSASASASAQAESVPAERCIGSSLAMFATTALCVVPRTYPILLIPAT